MENNRRSFLKLAAGAAAVSALPPNLRAALANPHPGKMGTIKDVEHVVIFMQENRSFDHYFGTLKGVRGFGDPRAVELPNGRPVWDQPDGENSVRPFHLDTAGTSAQFLKSLDHSWKGSHDLWKHHDAWIATKTEMTMGYFTRADIPFYHALADTFTICDAYHCSVFGPTTPNRLFLFTGTSGLTAGNDGTTAVENPPEETNETADPGNDAPAFKPLEWMTYAERLENAGIDWRVYQEYDNFGDNALAYFKQFRAVALSPEKHARARAHVEDSNAANAKTSRGEHLVAAFAKDVAENRLPQVSWIVAPTVMSEHPQAPPSYGESLTSRLLDALAANPKVWAKTVFILNYDENDGFFDHMPPPVPPITADLGESTADLTGESYRGVPFGLGPRVPAIIVSPWTVGGFVNSEVFDHTSVIRFLETRFGIAEPNISAWRRTVAGDLTSAFDFGNGVNPALPDGKDGIARADASLKRPVATHIKEALPRQEPGQRLARALPYDFDVSASIVAEGLMLAFSNIGKSGAHFRVNSRDPAIGPLYFTVGANNALLSVLPCVERYDYTLQGPNGFFRHFAGRRDEELRADFAYDRTCRRLRIYVENNGERPVMVRFRDAYRRDLMRTREISAIASGFVEPDIAKSANWYDISVEGPNGFVHQFAGHIENGVASLSDPLLG